MDGLILLAGRYEGIDQRVFDLEVDLEVSVGDYVVSGGELPAMVLLDSLIRLIPGVLNDENSIIEESHSDGLLEYPQYTRPEVFEGLSVPKVLLSGNHKDIDDWKKKEALEKTKLVRPDLLEAKPG
jgi:tRNA (guanine37-N1)-methyltransferase